MTSPQSTAPNPLARFRPDVQSMHAYAVQDARGMIKLDAMENPFTLPLHLQQQLGERLGRVAINRYPGASFGALKDALAGYVAMPAGCNITLGNGSDELIALLALACDVPGATILAPEPGFVMYALSAQLQGLQFVGVPLTADFTLDVKSILLSIEAHKPAITYIAYPNNPTATLFARADVEQVIAACRAVGGLVVIDEAYQPFAIDTFANTLGQPGYEHLLLLRTLSKFGLAGVRLGYLLGAQQLIAQIDKVRPPYNISVLNLEAALFALEHQDEFARQAALIVREREQLLVQLREINDLEVFDSQANMVLVRLPATHNADAVFAAMKACGVLIKNASKMHPLLANCLRLTVGAPDENVAMLAALRAALKAA